MAEISIVVPTRDRPGHIVECVRTLIQLDGDFAEIVVVDQSEDDEGERRLRSEIDDARLKVIRSSTRGVAAARNVGFAASKGDVILCTDDDCRAPGDWIAGYAAEFNRDPAADVVFGNVVLPEDRPPGFWAASFRTERTAFRDRIPRPHEPWGISANMGLRRACLERFGLFDEMLGAGGVFGSGAENDYTIRVIANGGVVAYIDASPMLHVGLRSESESSLLVRRYGVGLGAVGMKHLRLRSRPGWQFLGNALVAHSGAALRNVLRRQRPFGAGFALGLVKGAWRSSRVPIDRDRQVFKAERHL